MRIRRFRIVRDAYLGYEIQVWYLFFPFWIQWNDVNTFGSIEEAKEIIDSYKTPVYID